MNNKLTDEQLWESVKYTGGLYEAVEKITNQKVLENIVLEDEDFYVRYIALKKINNQKVLNRLVLKEKRWGVRLKDELLLTILLIKYLLRGL